MCACDGLNNEEGGGGGMIKGRLQKTKRACENPFANKAKGNGPKEKAQESHWTDDYLKGLALLGHRRDTLLKGAIHHLRAGFVRVSREE